MPWVVIRVAVDGVEAARVRRKKPARVAVVPGRHDVQLRWGRRGRYPSPVVPVELAQHESIELFGRATGPQAGINASELLSGRWAKDGSIWLGVEDAKRPQSANQRPFSPWRLAFFTGGALLFAVRAIEDARDRRWFLLALALAVFALVALSAFRELARRRDST